jgi:hypothetical protein
MGTRRLRQIAIPPYPVDLLALVDCAGLGLSTEDMHLGRKSALPQPLDRATCTLNARSGLLSLQRVE